jgi:selenide,water dikinase
VGLAVSDDAAVYKLNETTAIIQTIDFFTPIVDSPYDYGAIAAANAMSDVYAMGGTVALALNVCCFPKDLSPEVIAAILRGGAEKLAEAGGILAGGHTVDDKEPKYGLSVTGIVHPDKLLLKSGAQPGDALVLTKPLGTGVITTAFKGDRAEEDHFVKAVHIMKQLNKSAAAIFAETEAHACTDITGFSFLGHGWEIAEKSGQTLVFNYRDLPFIEGAIHYAEEYLFPAGAHNNMNCYSPFVDFASHVDDELQMLLFTPETSGGLLAAVPEKSLGFIEEQCKQNSIFFRIVGHVSDSRQHRIIVQ